jgi:hypothetical protein
VEVTKTPAGTQSAGLLDFEYHVIVPGTPWTGARLVGNGRAGAEVGAMGDARAMRVYAGQADAKDAGHFTVGVVVNGTARVVDGWLGEDDRVVLEVRGERVMIND